MNFPVPLLLALAALEAFVGFTWLALAMQTHWSQVHAQVEHDDVRSRHLRRAGAVALVTSLVLCLMADHPSMAVLVWLMLLAGAGVAVAMTLSTRPQWLRWAWPVGGAQ
jgi:hypothetical protein